MGIIPEADVTMVKYAPMGDPVELRIHSYELTLRLADAERIEIENIRDTKVEKHTLLPRNDKKNIPHPDLGREESTIQRKQKIHFQMVQY